jgi:hypothetical protein
MRIDEALDTFSMEWKMTAQISQPCKPVYNTSFYVENLLRRTNTRASNTAGPRQLKEQRI